MAASILDRLAFATAICNNPSRSVYLEQAFNPRPVNAVESADQVVTNAATRFETLPSPGRGTFLAELRYFARCDGRVLRGSIRSDDGTFSIDER